MRPAPKINPMTTAASEIWIGLKPWSRNWSGKRGSAFENWKIDWLNHRPIEAFTAIQVGASSQTCELRSKTPYRRQSTRGLLPAAARAARSSASWSATP